MAETDILNPVQGWWDVLGDNPNPNYGWTRRTATNKQAANRASAPGPPAKPPTPATRMSCCTPTAPGRQCCA